MALWHNINIEKEPLFSLRAHGTYLETKSIHMSRALSYLYGTEYEIWAGFGPVGSTGIPRFLKFRFPQFLILRGL